MQNNNWLSQMTFIVLRRKTTKQILFFFLSCLLLPYIPCLVQAATDLDILNSYKVICKARPDDSNVEAHFAPVRKLKDDEIKEDKKKWKYEFENEQKSYPNNRVLLSDGEVKRIFLVTTIRRQDIDSSPTYQWHVIAVPRVRNPENAYDGLWAESKRCIDRIINLNDWLRLIELSSVGGNPAHNLATETSKRLEVNQKWREIFGNKIIRDLIIESALNRKDSGITDESYDYTFYYAPVPSLNQINPEAFRWVSSRLVTRPGIAYGFILNAKGECIECTEVQIVPGN